MDEDAEAAAAQAQVEVGRAERHARPPDPAWEAEHERPSRERGGDPRQLDPVGGAANDLVHHDHVRVHPAPGSTTRSAVRNDNRSPTPASAASSRTRRSYAGRSSTTSAEAAPALSSSSATWPTPPPISSTLTPSAPRAAARRASERAIGSAPLRRYLRASFAADFSPKSSSCPCRAQQPVTPAAARSGRVRSSPSR